MYFLINLQKEIPVYLAKNDTSIMFCICSVRYKSNRVKFLNVIYPNVCRVFNKILEQGYVN